MGRQKITPTVQCAKLSPLDIALWHKKTFPDATIAGQKAKLKEERNEWEKSQDITELADVYIVACGLLRYNWADAMMAFHYIEEQCMLHSIFHKKLLNAVDSKMNVNYNRVWKETKEGSYHHI